MNKIYRNLNKNNVLKHQWLFREGSFEGRKRFYQRIQELKQEQDEEVKINGTRRILYLCPSECTVTSVAILVSLTGQTPSPTPFPTSDYQTKFNGLRTYYQAVSYDNLKNYTK